jgi:hypothetical protein
MVRWKQSEVEEGSPGTEEFVYPSLEHDEDDGQKIQSFFLNGQKEALSGST